METAQKLGLHIVRGDVERDEPGHRMCHHCFIVSGVLLGRCWDKGSYFEVGGFTTKKLIGGTPVTDWDKAAEVYSHLKAAHLPKPHREDQGAIFQGAGLRVS